MKRWLAIFLVVCMMVPIGVMAADYDGHWSMQYIVEARERGWMMGDTDGNFRPDDSITRGEFAVMLWRALGSPAPDGEFPFNDVPQDAFYRNAAASLYEMGVITGYEGGLLGANDTLTREMGCTMLARNFKLIPNNPDAYKNFDDWSEVSLWAVNEISSMIELEYISGVGQNLFAPLRALTRCEMAKLLVTIFDGEEDTAPTGIAITLTQTPKTDIVKNVEISVSVGSDYEIEYIGWRKSEENAQYTDKSNFTDITSKPEFNVDSNGWYAVCAIDSEGNYEYKLTQVTNVQTSTDDEETEENTRATAVGMYAKKANSTFEGSRVYNVRYYNKDKADVQSVYTMDQGEQFDSLKEGDVVIPSFDYDGLVKRYAYIATLDGTNLQYGSGVNAANPVDGKIKYTIGELVGYDKGFCELDVNGGSEWFDVQTSLNVPVYSALKSEGSRVECVTLNTMASRISDNGVPKDEDYSKVLMLVITNQDEVVDVFAYFVE